MANQAPTAFTVISTAVVVGIGLVFARGDFEEIPVSQIPLVIGGGLLGFAALVGIGYVVGKAWDGLIALLKRGWGICQRNRTR